jgi:hypothetical protein
MKIVIRKNGRGEKYITTLDLPRMHQLDAQYLCTEVNIMLWALMQEGLTSCFAYLVEGE